MRYFFSTGEASGELSAALLASAIRAYDRQALFTGIGAERMRAAGFTLWRDHTGWASMGPLGAIPRIPKLLVTMWRTAAHIAREQYDLVVLVDFGAFNLRLAQTLRRRLGYERPILYLFPPAAWLDDERRAREVASLAVPLTGFAHQYAFYKRLALPAVYFGHPLTGEYEMRPERPPAPDDGGTVAILPGSRRGELRLHLPRTIAAVRALSARRPRARAVFAAADAHARCMIAAELARAGLDDAEITDGARAALADADAAWVASGTAVLEAALCGVPTVAFYVIPRILVRYARSIYDGRFITLPNLVLGYEAVPELVQDAATPQALAEALDAALRDPAAFRERLAPLRAALGPADALDRCARFAVALAEAGTR